ncbi:MFS transporter [Cryptosporangium sp. NPDC051539]|uniref:MFS transporter n=1 Tax=Cryptosporangium sp. NPDC051539 TaxID=3363962 RepID=UPI0037AE45CE
MARSALNDTTRPDETNANRAGLGIAIVLWVGLAVSLLGDNFYRVGLTWDVTASGGAARATALGAAMAIPMAVLGLFAGTLVDRWNHPATMIVTDLLRAAVVGVFGLLYIMSSQPAFPLVLVFAALLAGSGACFTPAFQAWLPDLFPDRERLIRFDALFLTTISGIGVVGPASAGLLYPVLGLRGLLLFDAVTFGVSAVAIWYVVRHHAKPAAALTSAPEPRPPRPGLVSGTKEGLGYIFGNPVLRAQFTVFPVMECAAYALMFVLPLYLIETGQAESWLFGALLAANAAGRALGAWLLVRSPLRHRRGVVLAGNFLTQGLALALFCALHDPVLGLVAFALMGLPAGASQVALSSWVQTDVDRKIRGRVFGTLTTFVLWFMPFGPVIFGWVSTSFGPRWAVAIIAATFLGGGALIAASRAVRSLR